MKKSCSRCGRIHDMDFICREGGRPARYRQTEERTLRNTYRWHEKSKEIRQEADNLCEVCKDHGIYTYDGLEVHHITKLRDDAGGLLDNDNLICLCPAHHKMADGGGLDAEYLRSLARRREHH